MTVFMSTLEEYNQQHKIYLKAYTTNFGAATCAFQTGGEVTRGILDIGIPDDTGFSGSSIRKISSPDGGRRSEGLEATLFAATDVALERVAIDVLLDTFLIGVGGDNLILDISFLEDPIVYREIELTIVSGISCIANQSTFLTIKCLT